MMRGLAILLALGMSATAAHAADNTATAKQQAYGYAMRCFIANGMVLGEHQDAGKTEAANATDAHARRSFDHAVRLGGELGYSGNRIDQDFGLAQARELPKLVQDAAYFKKTTAICKALGLM